MDLFAGADRGGVPDDHGPFRIPTHGVTASEHCERAEAVEPCCGTPQPCVGQMDVTLAVREEAAVCGNEPGANRAETPPNVERFELQLQHPVGAFTGSQPQKKYSPQLVRQVVRAAAAQRHT